MQGNAIIERFSFNLLLSVATLTARRPPQPLIAVLSKARLVDLVGAPGCYLSLGVLLRWANPLLQWGNYTWIVRKRYITYATPLLV